MIGEGTEGAEGKADDSAGPCRAEACVMYTILTPATERIPSQKTTAIDASVLLRIAKQVRVSPGAKGMVGPAAGKDFFRLLFMVQLMVDCICIQYNSL